MAKLRTIIVEDEPLARAGLEKFCKEVAFIDLQAVCEDATEAHGVLSEHAVDLMFLDIQMPKITGIDFLKSIANPPMVVITTAYPNYALEGFELNVLDYLVKPFPLQRFMKAVNKAYDQMKLINKAETTISPPTETSCFIKVEHRLQKIDFEKLEAVEAMENYVIFHHDQKKFITMMTMKEAEKLLPESFFIRTHKSYIVNKSLINSIADMEIKTGNLSIPISRQRKKEVIDYLTS